MKRITDMFAQYAVDFMLQEGLKIIEKKTGPLDGVRVSLERLRGKRSGKRSVAREPGPKVREVKRENVARQNKEAVITMHKNSKGVYEA